MEQQIMQVNFKFGNASREFVTEANAVASMFTAVQGLQWKIWLMNEARAEAGGIYLFENKEALENFKDSGLFKAAANNPNFADFTVKEFGMLQEAGTITNAPVMNAGVEL